MSATGKSAGFTLIETLVVLGILGLISGLAFPRLQAMTRGAEYRASVMAAAALLRETRAAALRTAQPRRLAVAGDGALVAGATTAAAPDTIRFIVEPDTGIVFQPDGTSSGGRLIVQGIGRAARFAVSRTTGIAAPA